MAEELPIPPEALAHRSVEMIRVWLANQQQHVVLNIGFWEDRGLDERAAWGVVIADMVRHIADAHQSEYGHDPAETATIIQRAFTAEIASPTSERLGQFVKEKHEEAEPDSGVTTGPTPG
ncbi:MAG TPA: DUF5076 domain-containing protein [Urbifossiella sp.]|jgi:hypothetical protein|nr:DUF5076 domain-containing protein [Urbifossiella sp.]